MLCRKRAAVEAAAGDLRLREGAVGVHSQLVGAGLPGELPAVGVAMIKDVVFFTNFCNAPMVVAQVVSGLGVFRPAQVRVGDQYPLVRKGTLRTFSHAVAELMALEAGIDVIVPVPEVTHTGGLVEGVFLVACPLAGLDAVGADKGFPDDRVHIIGPDERPSRRELARLPSPGNAPPVRSPYRDIRRSHRRGRRGSKPLDALRPGAVCPLHMGQEFILPTRGVTDRHGDHIGEIHGIVEVVPSVPALHYIRSEQQMGQTLGHPVRDAGDGLILLEGFLLLPVDDAFIFPVSQIINGSAPADVVQQAELLSVILVVAAVDIDPVSEDTGLPVGNVLPLGR